MLALRCASLVPRGVVEPPSARSLGTIRSGPLYCAAGGAEPQGEMFPGARGWSSGSRARGGSRGVAARSAKSPERHSVPSKQTRDPLDTRRIRRAEQEGSEGWLRRRRSPVSTAPTKCGEGQLIRTIAIRSHSRDPSTARGTMTAAQTRAQSRALGRALPDSLPPTERALRQPGETLRVSRPHERPVPPPHPPPAIAAKAGVKKAPAKKVPAKKVRAPAVPRSRLQR